MRGKLRVKIESVINVIILILLFLVFIEVSNTKWVNFANVINKLAVISFAVSAWYFFLIIRTKVKIYDFRIYFIFFNMIFIMGQVWICFFGKEEYLFWKILLRANVTAIISGGMLALTIQQAIITGLFWGKERISSLKSKPKNCSKNMLWYTGLITFILFFPLKFYYDIIYMISAAGASGYLDSSQISVNGMVYCFGVVSLVGIFYMIESKKLSKTGVLLLIGCISIYFIITMLGTGDRRFAIIALLCMVLCFIHSYRVKMKASLVLFIGCLAYICLIFLNIISSTRKTTGIPSGVQLLNALWAGIISLDILWNSFAEFGITLMCYVYTWQLFPSIFPFRWGSQLLVNIVAILPVGGAIARWREKTGIQTSVNSYVNQPLGGALGTDLYGNFGIMSFILAAGIGIFLKRIMDVRKTELSDFESAKYFSLMYIMINIVRAGFGEVIRLGFYCYFVPLGIMGMLLLKQRRQGLKQRGVERDY